MVIFFYEKLKKYGHTHYKGRTYCEGWGNASKHFVTVGRGNGMGWRSFVAKPLAEPMLTYRRVKYGLFDKIHLKFTCFHSRYNTFDRDACKISANLPRDRSYHFTTRN